MTGTSLVIGNDTLLPAHDRGLGRRHFLIGGAATILTGGAAIMYPAHGQDRGAEDFMRTVLVDANAAMGASADKKEQFRLIDRLVDRHVDMRRTGRFVLGRYARQMTQEQAADYYPLFRKFATLIYQNILSEYDGEALEVTGSVTRSARDIIVNSKVINSRPGDRFADTVFQWRLYRAPKGLKVVDAGANNIWLAIEQRSQFESVIANNGGGTKGIDALISQLRKRVG
ncbi:MAG: ABC transporter substrate-binding protein [Pseudomonadota bacterium]